MIEFDGQKYEKKEDIPDIGGFDCTNHYGENVRSYVGLSSGIEKFKANVTYAGNGSTALCVDNGNYYMFFDGSWYKL